MTWDHVQDSTHLLTCSSHGATIFSLKDKGLLVTHFESNKTTRHAHAHASFVCFLQWNSTNSRHTDTQDDRQGNPRVRIFVGCTFGIAVPPSWFGVVCWVWDGNDWVRLCFHFFCLCTKVPSPMTESPTLPYDIYIYIVVAWGFSFQFFSTTTTTATKTQVAFFFFFYRHSMPASNYRVFSHYA